MQYGAAIIKIVSQENGHRVICEIDGHQPIESEVFDDIETASCVAESWKKLALGLGGLDITRPC